MRSERMLLGELQNKDVVNVVDGGKLGRISDVDLDSTTGKINSITIKPQTRLANLFSSNNSVVVLWDKIVKIGDEVVIVNFNGYVK